MTKGEALNMAIEQMQHLIKIYIPSPEWSGTAIQEDCYEVIQACKEALEQPAQKPDYWLGYGLQAHDEKPFEGATPLYTHPAPVCKCGECGMRYCECGER